MAPPFGARPLASRVAGRKRPLGIQRSTSFDLYSLRLSFRTPRARSRPARSALPSPCADRIGELIGRLCRPGELDADRERRFLLHAFDSRPDEDGAADLRLEALTISRTADGKRSRRGRSACRRCARCSGRAGLLPHAQGSSRPPLVARAEAQERRRPVPRCVSTARPSRRPPSTRARRVGVDQLEVDDSVRAEVHAGLVLALAPERRADVADAHRLGDLRAPALLELLAEGRLAAAGLARDEDALHA